MKEPKTMTMSELIESQRLNGSDGMPKCQDDSWRYDCYDEILRRRQDEDVSTQCPGDRPGPRASRP